MLPSNSFYDARSQALAWYEKLRAALKNSPFRSHAALEWLAIEHTIQEMPRLSKSAEKKASSLLENIGSYAHWQHTLVGSYVHACWQRTMLIEINSPQDLFNASILDASTLHYSCEHIVIFIKEGLEITLEDSDFFAYAAKKSIRLITLIVGANATVHLIMKHKIDADAYAREYHVYAQQDSTIHIYFGSFNKRGNGFYGFHFFLCAQGASVNVQTIFGLSSKASLAMITKQYHDAPNTTSNVLVSGIISGQNTFLYDGIIKLTQNALHAVAHQKNKNLALSQDAHIYVRPTIEIDTDDVQCSHGSALGFLQEEELLYLSTRMPEDMAKQILIEAFLHSATQNFSASLAQEMVSLILDK